MEQKEMTAEEIKEYIAKVAKRSWEQVVQLDSLNGSRLDSSILANERWFVLDTLCSDLGISY